MLVVRIEVRFVIWASVRVYEARRRQPWRLPTMTVLLLAKRRSTS